MVDRDDAHLFHGYVGRGDLSGGVLMSKIRINNVPRKVDDHALMLLRLRCQGYKPTVIGKGIGKNSQYVSTLVNRIRRADQAESGESLEVVNRGYWR